MRPPPEPQAPGIYVHVPFCRRVCPYCDFAVAPLGRSGARGVEYYREALLAEIGLRAGPLGADSIYFGGGTPSLLPPDGLEEIVSALVASGLAAPDAFVTLEANPEDLTHTPDLARAWAGSGVSGVSLGAQSLDEDRLRFLGRLHTADAVRDASRRLAEAAIRWISVDLIYGTAGQGLESLERELRAAADLPGVTHLSAYELTVEEGTPFGRRAARGERLAAEEGAGGAAFRRVHETLEDCGLPAYEASNFARSERHRSRHNPKYWTGTAYLGLGPSAHSFDPSRAERSWNERAVGPWRDAVERRSIPVAGREVLSLRERALEAVFLGLRTAWGIDLDDFAARYGAESVAANSDRFHRWEAEGLARMTSGAAEGRLALTLAGLAVADALAREVDLESVNADPRAAAA